MKAKINTLSVLLLFVCACTVKNEPDAIHDEYYYIEKLSDDLAFHQYMENVGNWVTLPPRHGINGEELMKDLISIESETQMPSVISKYYEDPKGYIESMKTMVESANIFWSQNPDVMDMEMSQKQLIIESLALEYLQSPNLRGTVFGAKTTGSCEEELEISKQSCLENSLLAAASCGLLSPTILGALGCGAFVIAADIACHRSASRQYETCKNHK